MKIKEVIGITKGKLIQGDEETEVNNICKDTRIIKSGETYIGIKGEKFDGNLLWKESFEKGASTVIVQNVDFNEENLSVFENKNIILVEDTIQALGKIAEYKRDSYGNDFNLVGVTGSVGKTSTRDIIASVLSEKYKTLKTQGNFNNDVGLPFTILELKDHEAAVIEMGMNHLGEISYLSGIAKPKIAVITNVGTAHIGNLGSRENILKAKLEILDGMKKKVLVINNDNDLLNEFYLKNKENKDIEIHTFGIENQSEVMAEDILLQGEQSEFICKINGEKFKIKVPVGGLHFIYNALCGAIVGKLLGLSNKEIVNGIKVFELTKNRMSIEKLENGVTIINDSYNASFDSMKASIEYLSKLENTRKIAVLGDMFELGEYSEELHHKVGLEVAKNNIDILMCMGENAKYIVESAKENGMNEKNICYFQSKEEMLENIKNIWKSRDTILFKASNGMRFFEIVENLKNRNVHFEQKG